MNAMQMMILERQYHDDLKKELKGVTFTSAGSKETSEAVQTGESATNVEENPGDDMGKIMMSRKKRKLLEAMQVIFFLPHACEMYFCSHFQV